MSFEANKLPEFEHKITDLPDQPNMQPDELKAYFDSSPEQLRQAYNGLCDALTEATSSTTAAANLGFQRTAGVPADNVQDAIEDVQSQLTDAVLGNIPSGSVTNDKLAQDVRDHFTTIETAASSEASTRASADSSLQSQINTHTTQISSKCEAYVGSYTGNDQASQYIALPFAPKAVLVCNKYGDFHSLPYLSGGMALAGFNFGIEISGNGFYVKTTSDGSSMNSSTASPYGFLAFK